MITRYIPVATLTAAAFSLMSFGPALEVAQAQDQQPMQGQPGGNGPAVSDQKIDAFAVAYLQVDKVRQEYSNKIGATPDDAAKQKLQTEAKQKMVEAVESSPNITVQEYTSILTQAQSDQALAKKLKDKIDSEAPQQQ